TVWFASNWYLSSASDAIPLDCRRPGVPRERVRRLRASRLNATPMMIRAIASTMSAPIPSPVRGSASVHGVLARTGALRWTVTLLAATNIGEDIGAHHAWL